MNESYLHSTYLKALSQEEDATTIKSISFSILPGENTDTNMSISIFNLPVEFFEKSIKSERKAAQREKEEINVP